MNISMEKSSKQDLKDAEENLEESATQQL